MSTLAPVPFPDLVRRMRREVEARGALFDLPVRKWFAGAPGMDLGAHHFRQRAATPVGPAAGPHTQLAQNIILSWLAGGRIMELKTVQINDRLTIPRPCIHAPNVGYNVEWSQELRTPESAMEYAKAAYLIAILGATRAFGALPEAMEGDTVFDVSVGYDLAGLRSEAVTAFLRSMRRPAPLYEALRGQLDGELAAYREVELPAALSESVTLSTFHGCPADEIEAMARYLMEELGFATIIKLNPTLLGFEAVEELLHGRLGYHHLQLRREDFRRDLQYDDGLEIFRRLRQVAADRGTEVGAKFTNTLVVANDPALFPTQSEPTMYLSGPPLHVISMTLMQRFRDEVGFELPISFSAGIDAANFPAAVACGMVPVTTCTDLLRQGGYGRLPAYLRHLARRMGELGVASREAYVLAAGGHGARAVEAALAATAGGAALWRRRGAELEALARESPNDLPATLRRIAGDAGLEGEALVRVACRIAGRLNGREIVSPLADDPRYHARANSQGPRRVDRRLALYDCINCDLCISACPNDAVFAYAAEPVEAASELLAGDGGQGLRRSPGAGFRVTEGHQLAVVEGGCNDCSNCEVYCPEEGAPFKVKERLFLTPEAFAASELDGFCRQGEALLARLGGLELRLEPDPPADRALLLGDGLRLELTWDPPAVSRGWISGRETTLDTALLWRMKTVWEAIYHSPTPNMLHPDPPPSTG